MRISDWSSDVCFPIYHPCRVGDGRRRQHHRAEERLLGLEVVRGNPPGGTGAGGLGCVGSCGHGGFTFLQRACGALGEQTWGLPLPERWTTADRAWTNLWISRPACGRAHARDPTSRYRKSLVSGKRWSQLVDRCVTRNMKKQKKK